MLILDSVKHLDLDFVEGQTNKPTTKTLTHVAYNSFFIHYSSIQFICYENLSQGSAKTAQEKSELIKRKHHFQLHSDGSGGGALNLGFTEIQKI